MPRPTNILLALGFIVAAGILTALSVRSDDRFPTAPAWAKRLRIASDRGWIWRYRLAYGSAAALFATTAVLLLFSRQ